MCYQIMCICTYIQWKTMNKMEGQNNPAKIIRLTLKAEHTV